VIEDDDGARQALADLLALDDYDVSVACDGFEALPLVDEAHPDLVVMDWRMPNLSGLALCRALRLRHEGLPIIVVTSADEPFEHDQPVNAMLRKPVDPPQLQRVIREELGGAV
jgi:CheY-like chemotaxis protein